MLVLALDTATPLVVLGVVELDDRSVRAAASVLSGNRHAETLGELIPEVLRSAGLTPADLSAVVVGLGPGPFTGLRVGIVTAAALGDALGIPVHGVCTHDAIAARHAALAGSRSPGTTALEGGFVVVTDARRRECYWATYDAAGTRTSGPAVASPTDALQSPDWRPDGLVIGDPAFSVALGTEVLSAQPDPVGLALAAPELVAGEPPGPLEPMYLRRPDATPPGSRKPQTPAF